MDKLRAYQKINNSFKKSLVFHFGTGNGFYSEYNNMLLCMLYCLKYKIRFVLYSKDAYFTFGNGISEFFIPFCTEVTSNFHHKFNKRDIPFTNETDLKSKLKQKIAITNIYLYKLFTGNYITSDFYYEYRTFWFAETYFDIPELGIKGNAQTALGQLAKIIYNFNDKYRDDIILYKNKIKLPTSSYVGFHIRGGDKIIERELISIDHYISKMESITDIRNAFVMTDDYKIYIDLINKYPNWQFYTLTKESEQGYNNSSFMKESYESRKNNIIKMFASIEYLRESKYIVGTYSANPGMFLGMIEGAKMHGIDYDKWLIL